MKIRRIGRFGRDIFIQVKEYWGAQGVVWGWLGGKQYFEQGAVG
jgi:hypothetical protein